jgi:hypothetical protein
MVRALGEHVAKRRAAKEEMLARKRKGSAASYPGRVAVDKAALALEATDPALLRAEAVSLTRLSWLDVDGLRLGSLCAAVAELKPALVAFGTSSRKVDGAADDDTREEPKLDRDSLELALDIVAAEAVTDQDDFEEAVETLEAKMANRWPPGIAAGSDDDSERHRLDQIKKGFDRSLRILLHSVREAARARDAAAAAAAAVAPRARAAAAHSPLPTRARARAAAGSRRGRSRAWRSPPLAFAPSRAPATTSAPPPSPRFRRSGPVSSCPRMASTSSSGSRRRRRCRRRG